MVTREITQVDLLHKDGGRHNGDAGSGKTSARYQVTVVERFTARTDDLYDRFPLQFTI